jgi:hypothetical protein
MPLVSVERPIEALVPIVRISGRAPTSLHSPALDQDHVRPRSPRICHRSGALISRVENRYGLGSPPSPTRSALRMPWLHHRSSLGSALLESARTSCVAWANVRLEMRCEEAVARHHTAASPGVGRRAAPRGNRERSDGEALSVKRAMPRDRCSQSCPTTTARDSRRVSTPTASATS